MNNDSGERHGVPIAVVCFDVLSDDVQHDHLLIALDTVIGLDAGRGIMQIEYDKGSRLRVT